MGRALPFTAFVLLSPATAVAQGEAQRLSVHWYLTQAYGIADRHQVAGLNRDGTADYRRAAIIARYAATPADQFVVQLAHRRLGDSPAMQFEQDVKLDLAFYERRFGSRTSVRVGKIALPFGIYNEVRYAGTLTPFYRAPLVVYRDGTYASETIDGATASHLLRAGEPWEVSLDAYGGGFQQVEFGPTFPPGAPPVYAGAVLTSKNVLGGQVWLATPITGLRFGLGGRRQTDMGGIFERPGGAQGKLWTASVDGSFDRGFARAERLRHQTFGFELVAMYAQAGVRVLPRVGVNVQSEVRDERLRFTPTSPWFDVKAGRDNALGVNIHTSSTSIVKFEAHAAKGYSFLYERTVDVSAPPLTSAYFISSFSVSF